jgi:WD40 repeat protein
VRRDSFETTDAHQQEVDNVSLIHSWHPALASPDQENFFKYSPELGKRLFIPPESTQTPIRDLIPLTDEDVLVTHWNSSAFFWRPFDETAFGFFHPENTKSRVQSSVITTDRRFLILGLSDGGLAFIDQDRVPLTGQVLPIVHSKLNRIYRLVISDDSKILLVTDNGKDVISYNLQLNVLDVTKVDPDRWDQTGVVKRLHELHASNDVRWLSFAENNTCGLCSCRGSRSVYMWNLSSGKELRKLTFDEEVGGLAMMPNGRYLTVDTKSKLTFWSLPKLEKLDETPYRGCSSDCNFIALSPDGRYLAASSGMVIILFDLKNGTIAGDFEVNPSHDDFAKGSILTGGVDPIETAAFLPDGKHIVSGQSMGGLKLWDLSQFMT